MRHVLIASAMLAAAALAAPALAQDAPVKPFTLTGSITGVTDYRFRGVTQTNKNPAIQGSLTVTSSSGFYVSTWASNIDKGTAAGADAEVDLIAGYGVTTAGLSLDGGVLYYYYPGAIKGANTDFFEPYASVKYAVGPATLKAGAAYAPKQHAIASVNARDDNLYLYGEASGSVPGGVSLTGHVGHNYGRSFLTAGLKGYTDWSLTANYTWNHLTFGVAYVDTDLKGGSFTTRTGKDAGKATIVGSVGFAF